MKQKGQKIGDRGSGRGGKEVNEPLRMVRGKGKSALGKVRLRRGKAPGKDLITFRIREAYRKRAL